MSRYSPLVPTFLGSYASEADANAFLNQQGWSPPDGQYKSTARASGISFWDSSAMQYKVLVDNSWQAVGPSPGGSGFWQRADLGSGDFAVFPVNSGDDVVVGPSGTPGAKIFADGDAVFGAGAMVGTERVRIVGDLRLEGGIVGTGGSVSGDWGVANDLDVGNDLDVTGRADVGTDLDVVNDLGVGNDLTVAAQSIFGGAAPFGSEVVRAQGDVRIDSDGQLLIANSATQPPLNVTERSAPPSAPAAGDIYLDDGTNTASGNPGWRRYTGAVWEDIGATTGGGTSPWTEAAGVLYPTTFATDDVVIGANAMSGAERLRVVGNTRIEGQFDLIGANDLNVVGGDFSVGGGPNGRWFNDGDMVVGGNAMSGTEKLRVVGNARIEGNLEVTGVIDPTEILYVDQLAAPVTPAPGSTGIYSTTSGLPTGLSTAFFVIDPLGATFRVAYATDDVEFVYNPSASIPGGNPAAGVKTWFDSGTSRVTMTDSTGALGDLSIGTGFSLGYSFGGGTAPAGSEVTRTTGGTTHLEEIVFDEEAAPQTSPIGASIGVLWMDSSDDHIKWTNSTTTFDLTTGGGSGVNVQEGGVGLVGNPYSTINFGAGVTAVDVGGTVALITSDSFDYSGGVIYPATSPDNDTLVIGAAVMSGTFNEMVRVLADPNPGGENELVGFLAQDADTDVGIGGSFTGFVAHGLSTGGASSGSFTGFSVAPPTAGFGGYTVVGYYYPDMAGTAFLGSTGFWQAGEGEINTFVGRTGFGGGGGSGITVRSNTPSGGITADWINVQAYRNVNNTTSSPGNDWYAYDAYIVQPFVVATHYMDDVRFYNVSSPLSSQPVVIANAAGLYVEQLKGTTNFTFTNDPYGVYQAGTQDLNYFAGKVGIAFDPAAAGLEVLNVQDDLSDSSDTVAIFAQCGFNGAGTKSSFTGVDVRAAHAGSGTITDSVGYGVRTTFGDSAGDLTTFDGFQALAVATAAGNTIGTYKGLHVRPSAGSGTITTAYGVHVEDVGLNTTIAYGIRIDDLTASGSAYAIYQSGADDLNFFNGNIGIGVTPISSALLYAEDDLSTTAATIGLWTYQSAAVTGTKSSWTGLLVQGGHSSTGTITTAFGVDAGFTLGAGAAGAMGSVYGFRSSMTLGNAGDVITNGYGFYGVAKSGAGTLTNAYGLYLEAQGGGTLSYGIYQAGAADDNYFAGDVGIGDATPSYPLDVAGDVNVQTGSVYRHNGAAGLSGTYTFGGGGSGDIASMTFAGGILTAVTTVP